MGQIFISHSSANDPDAKSVQQWLLQQGWGDVFLDLDPAQGLAPGQRWREELKKAGERCAAVIVLVSPAWADSKWCITEFLFAAQLGKQIFPLLVEPCPLSLLPVELTSTYQFADISTAEKRVDGFNRLAIGMHRAGLRPGAFPWPPDGEPNRPLYRGLRMLEEPDAAIYFGRDTQITKALDTIRQMRDATAERMLVILGASGAGKSSFLRAGLLSRLKRDQGHFLVLPTLRPGRAALTGSAGLLNALSLDELIDPARLSVHLADLRASSLRSLQQHAEEPVPATPLLAPTIVLPIDQAEELFVEGEKEAAEVIPLIAAMVAADPHLLVLLTIRSDSFERLQADQRLSEISRRPFDLPRLSSSAFKEIIVGPAGLPDTGLAVDTDLTEQLLADFNGSDALPLLAFALERLVADHGSDGRLGKREYLDDMKGMGGAIRAAVERAFAQAADNDGLPHGRAELNELARRCFVPGLVMVDNDVTSPKRRIALRRELPESALPLIDCLADQRLLVTDSTGREPTVEVAHEAVLRHWRDLAGWVADRREDLLALERVTAAADEWARATGTGKEEAIAHRGERLQAAEKLLGWDDLGWARDDYRVAYIVACRAAETRSVMQRRRIRHWIGGLVAAAAFVTVIGALLVVHGQRNLGRSESLMLARAADRLVQEGDLPRASRLAILAAHENTLKPGSAYARATLASVALLNKLRREWRGHAGAVLGAVFSSDESQLLTWSADDTVRLWDAATGTQIGSALVHDSGGVRGAAFSADERTILSWSADKTARLWDAATGTPIGPALRHERGVIGALFSPDQRRILTWDSTGSARLWNAASGAEVGPTLRHKGAIMSAVYSSDGQRILTWSSDDTARLWAASSGEQIGPALQHEDSVVGAVYSPDERQILTWSLAGDARVWDAADSAPVTPVLVHDASVMGARFSSDGRRVLTWSRDKSARLWDADSGEQIGPALQHEDSVVGAVFSPDGRQILTWASDKVARLWKTADGTRVGPALVHDGEIEEGKFSPDGKHILTWSDTKTARLWDAAKGTPIPLAMTHDDRLRGARFAAGGRRVLTWSDDATVRLWGVTGDDQTGRVFTHDGSVFGALFSSDGRHILSWSDDNTARLWDADNGVQIGPALAHERVVWGARFSRDERRVLTWSLDGSARQWDTKSGDPIGPLLTHDDAVLGAVYSPDERRVLTWGKDGSARLWDAVSGAMAAPAFTHDEEVDGAIFAPDGRRILTWGKDKTVRQWDAATGTAVGPALPHTYWVKGARYSSDAQRILSWDAASARLWDTASGARIGPELKHDGAVLGATFAPDERHILTWSQDNTAQLWDVASGARAGPALRHGDQVRDGVFSSNGRRILTWGHDNTARQWDADSGAQIGSTLKHDDIVTGAVFLIGERRILTWSLDGSARIWDAASGVQIGPALEGSVRGALPAPDGDRILTWSWHNSLHLWPVEEVTRPVPVQTLIDRLCRDNLSGESMAVDASGLQAGVRHLDARDIEYAPILEGRQGEDVCAAPPSSGETLWTLLISRNR